MTEAGRTMAGRVSGRGSDGGSLLTHDAVCLLASAIFYMMSAMAYTPIQIGYTVSLGATVALAGTIGGLMNLCSLVVRPVAGNLTDRVTKQRLATIGLGLIALASIGCTVAAAPWQLALARVVYGIGFSLGSVCMSTWFAQVLPPSRVGAAMGVYGMMNALGMAVGPSFGLLLYRLAGYRVAIGFCALCGVLSLAVMRLVRDPGRPMLTEGARGGGDTSAAPSRLRLIYRPAITAALLIAIFAIPYCATQSFLVKYVADRGIPVAVELFFPLYAGTLLALRVVLRDAFDRWPLGRFVLASAASSLVAMAALCLMRGNAAMLIAAVGTAGGYGIMCSVCQTAAVRAGGAQNAGIANSTYYIGFDMGMFLGPAIGGVLYGAIDLAWFYPALMLTAPLALLVYAIGRKR